MKNLLLFLMAAIVGVVLIIAYAQVSSSPTDQLKNPVSSKKTPFSIEKPPEKSLEGAIESLDGNVEWQSRTAQKPTTITKPRALLQGETLITKENGTATATFKNDATIHIQPDTTVDIVQTLPANLVFQQNVGAVEYEQKSDIPLSVRSRHVLFDFKNAMATIHAEKDLPTIIVEVQKGSVTAAFNDLNNFSTVVAVPEGKTLIYNDETRETELE